MARRKWFLRSMIPIVILLVVAGVQYASTWIKPAFIREQVLAHLHGKFKNVDIEVEHARLRFFGGISVFRVTLIRKDDPTRTPLLEIPNAVLQQDKDRLAQGEIVIRKIEMNDAVFRIHKRKDGTLNWQDILLPPKDDDPIPVISLKRGKLHWQDDSVPGRRELELAVPKLVMVNDPTEIYKLEGLIQADESLRFPLQVEYNEKEFSFRAETEFQNLGITRTRLDWLFAYLPEIKEEVHQLRGVADARIQLRGRHQPKLEITPEIQFTLRKGSYEHQALPLPLKDIQLHGLWRDTQIDIPDFQARSGSSDVSARAILNVPRGKPRRETLAIPVVRMPPNSPQPKKNPSNAADIVDNVEVTLRQVELNAEFFERLPASIQVLHRMFQPVGPTDIRYSMKRENGDLIKRCRISPQGIRGRYEEFPYPLSNLQGTIEQVMKPGELDRLDLNLTAEAKGKPVVLTGTILGDKPEDKDVALTIRGKGIVVDEDLIAALPDQYPELVRRLRAKAEGDFTALIRHNKQVRADHGETVFDNFFDIQLYNAALNYTEFPYPLKDVKGNLIIRTVPDRPTKLPDAKVAGAGKSAIRVPVLEVAAVAGQSPPITDDTGMLFFKNFSARHGNARLKIDGSRLPATGGSLLQFTIQGEQVPFDLELREALSRLRLDPVWETFHLQGQMNCTVHANVFEQAKTKENPNPSFEPNRDLSLGLAFSGPTITPEFFPYPIQNLQGQLSYYKGKVDLQKFEGQHRQVRFRLPRGEVRIPLSANGGYYAELKDLQLVNLPLDKTLNSALPPILKEAFQAIDLRGEISMFTRNLIVYAPPGAAPPQFLPGKEATASSTVPDKNVRPNTNTATATDDNVRQAAFFPQDKNDAQTPFRTRRNSSKDNEIPTIYWDSRIQLRDVAFDTGIGWENASGELAVEGRLDKEQLSGLRGNLFLDKATVLKLPLTDVILHMEVPKAQPNILVLPNFQAKLLGGDLSGEAQVLVQDKPLFDLKLNATRLKLTEFARTQKLSQETKLEGLAAARLYLSNRQRTENGLPLLEGFGGIDIPQGANILNVPKLVNLLKALKLKYPDQAFFSEAHATFRIRGKKLHFGQIDLLGDAISLGGSGGMLLDGNNLDLNFYTIPRFHDNLRAGVGQVSELVSKSLLQIEVKGDLNGKIDYQSRPIPFITGPVRRLFEPLAD